MNNKYSIRGKHIILDIWGIDASLLDDLEFMECLMMEALSKIEINVVGKIHKKFVPCGLTILILLEESHFSAHNFSEYGFSSIDLYSCGNADPQIAINYMIEILKPIRYNVRAFERGVE